MKRVIITICFVLLVPAVCASGADRLVPSQYPTIQAAVNAALDGDTVIIAPGTYTGPGNYNVSVSKAITIRSQEGPETCIIDCNGSSSQPHTGFAITNGTLAGITIIRGYSFNGGGAVYCNTGSAKLINCILTGNISKQGGAVYCAKSSIEITNCSLTNNSSGVATAGSGGAIYCQDGSVLVANSTISGNSSGTGGGIYCRYQGNITIKNCVISDNSALGTSNVNLSAGGGGIFCNRGSLTVIGSQIRQNSSLVGAGIYCYDATSSFISDCNIHGNVAESLGGEPACGGGIYNKVTNLLINRTPFSIIKSSITDNVVKGGECKGGGLYLEIYPPLSQIPSVMFANCIVARNSALPPENQGYSYGGGIYSAGRILLSETDIKENSAVRGGGIYNQFSGTNISRCRISGNSAMYGSAIECYTGEIVIESTVISGNQPSRLDYHDCSVIQCSTSVLLKITNCTIVGNVPPLVSSQSQQSNSSSSITNSIIYWNTQDPKFIWKLPPNSLTITYSDIQGGYAGTGNIDADPCFAIPGHWDTNGTPYSYYDDFWVEGDYRLTAVSPCIDAGTYVPLSDNKDLAGKPRVMGGSIDMGAYENNNTSPVAEAGPDQIVYAWIDGNAAVTLDGSKSYDAEGDKLSYLWDWTIDGGSYEANGVSPTIKLPVGEHKIELIVNDTLEDSQPDDVNITVAGPVEGQLWVIPSAINRQSKQPNILAMLKLPAGITKEQIDSGYKLLLYPCGIEAKTQYTTQNWDNGSGRIGIVASFDRSALLASVGTNGNLKLYAVGRLTTGQYFFGQNIVRIISQPPITILLRDDN